MFVPEIKDYTSPLADDLNDFVPSDPEDFGIQVDLIVGPRGEPGKEWFSLVICTLSWFHKEELASGVASGRSRLFVKKWDWPLIRTYLENEVRLCTDDNWIRCGLRISSLARWEFEQQAIDAIDMDVIP